MGNIDFKNLGRAQASVLQAHAVRIATSNVNGVNARLATLLQWLAQTNPDVVCTRHLYPQEKIYTFWVNADAFRRNAGFRMDFLLLNANHASRLTAAGVDTGVRGRERASDHAPVSIAWAADGSDAAGNEVRAAARNTGRPL